MNICSILLIDLGTKRESFCEPLGIETISAHILAKFPNIILKQKSFEFDPIEEIESALTLDFDIIGISTKITSYGKLHRLILKIQRIKPSTIIILGDVLATYAYDKIMARYEDVICVRGEGENSINKIIQLYLNHGNSLYNYLEEIPNLAYAHKGKHIVTVRSTGDVIKPVYPNRVFIQKIKAVSGQALIEASRGCVYNQCSFCGIPEKYGGRTWRPFDMDFVIKEIEHLSNLGIKSPHFTDEDFIGDAPERAIEFCHRVIEAKQSGKIQKEIDFYLNVRVDSLTQINSMPLMKLFKEAGLREIAVGIESGCVGQLKRYQKQSTTRKNLIALNLLANLNIDVDVGFIFFDPRSSLNNLRENMNFIKAVKPIRNYSRLFKKIRLQPFTKITKSPTNFNKDNFNMNSACYEYEFEDSKVGELYSLYHEFESLDLPMIYSLQTLSRGEVPDSEIRKALRDIIGVFRNMHCEYLDTLIQLFECGNYFEWQLKEITIKFEQTRQTIIETYQNQIDHLIKAVRTVNRSIS